MSEKEKTRTAISLASEKWTLWLILTWSFGLKGNKSDLEDGSVVMYIAIW